jgi:hypothetical protein
MQSLGLSFQIDQIDHFAFKVGPNKAGRQKKVEYKKTN